MFIKRRTNSILRKSPSAESGTRAPASASTSKKDDDEKKTRRRKVHNGTDNGTVGGGEEALHQILSSPSDTIDEEEVVREIERQLNKLLRIRRQQEEGDEQTGDDCKRRQQRMPEVATGAGKEKKKRARKPEAFQVEIQTERVGSMMTAVPAEGTDARTRRRNHCPYASKVGVTSHHRKKQELPRYMYSENLQKEVVERYDWVKYDREAEEDELHVADHETGRLVGYYDHSHPPRKKGGGGVRAPPSNNNCSNSYQSSSPSSNTTSSLFDSPLPSAPNMREISELSEYYTSSRRRRDGTTTNRIPPPEGDDLVLIGNNSPAFAGASSKNSAAVGSKAKTKRAKSGFRNVLCNSVGLPWEEGSVSASSPGGGVCELPYSRRAAKASPPAMPDSLTTPVNIAVLDLNLPNQRQVSNLTTDDDDYSDPWYSYIHRGRMQHEMVAPHRQKPLRSCLVKGSKSDRQERHSGSACQSIGTSGETSPQFVMMNHTRNVMASSQGTQSSHYQRQWPTEVNQHDEHSGAYYERVGSIPTTVPISRRMTTLSSVGEHDEYPDETVLVPEVSHHHRSMPKPDRADPYQLVPVAKIFSTPNNGITPRRYRFQDDNGEEDEGEEEEDYIDHQSPECRRQRKQQQLLQCLKKDREKKFQGKTRQGGSTISSSSSSSMSSISGSAASGNKKLGGGDSISTGMSELTDNIVSHRPGGSRGRVGAVGCWSAMDEILRRVDDLEVALLGPIDDGGLGGGDDDDESTTYFATAAAFSSSCRGGRQKQQLQLPDRKRRVMFYED